MTKRLNVQKGIPEKMNFYKVASAKGTPPQTAEFPCITLQRDTWDDYDTKSLHYLVYWPNPSASKKLGSAKILQKDVDITEIPKDFENLPPGFITLGQSLEFYKSFRETFHEKARNVLAFLNDVVVKPALLTEWETTSRFRNSMIRFNDAKTALRQGSRILSGHTPEILLSFTYSGDIPGASEPVEVGFDLDGEDIIPGRLCAIIGKNGVGKTQFLARLARDLVTQEQVSQKRVKAMESKFSPERPLFSRVIALSFSAFDKFWRPEEKEHFSYVYCGVRDDSNRLSKSSLEHRHKEFVKRIRDQDRLSVWQDCIEMAIGEEESKSIRKAGHSDVGLVDSAMSSGQSILTYFISAVIAYIKEDSLIIFDEPELHLHPNAVATLMEILHYLLKKYEAYAIISTHSPLVIQDVPGKRVTIFERDDTVTTAFPLSQETFGENVSELTRIVFDTVEMPSYYKTTLKRLSKNRTFAEVVELFPVGLSLHAASYLASLYD